MPKLSGKPKNRNPPAQVKSILKCYIDGRGWVPVSEAVEMPQTSPKPGPVRPTVRAILALLRESRGRPVAVPAAEGWYEGLLLRLGALRVPSVSVTLGEIREAWKLFRTL